MQKAIRKPLSILLALLMLLSPLSVSAVAAGVKDTLVSQLASLYDGDVDRARSDLAVLYDAGIIDEDGNMVALDVREDGAPAELDDAAQRIANGETVGELTVNGNAASPEQIVQIQQVSSILEMLRLIDNDIEITDDHVANFKALVAGLADGSIDLDEAIGTGSVSVKNARRSPLRSDPAGYETGDLELSDGTFTAPMLNGDSYDASYAFSAGAATAWYSDNAHKGITADGVVTLTTEDKESYAPGETVTVTASLSEAQTLPVSFDWKAGGNGVGVAGDAAGTVTWAAGDTEDKTFSFTIADKADGDLWQGSRALVINASNVRNALFSDNATTWSKTVQVASSDNDAIKASYTTTDTVSGFTSTTGYDARGKKTMTIHKKFTGSDAWKIPQNGNCTITVAHFGSAGMQIAIVPTTADVNPVANSTANSKIIQNFQNNNVGWTDTTHYLDSASPKTVNVGNLPSGTVNNSGETIVVLFFADNVQGVGNLSLKSFTIAARKPSEHDLVQSVSVPAGAYHSGEVVPVTVELDNYVKADANTVLTVNGESCALLDGTNTETKKLTFGYTVKAMDTGAVNVTALTGLKNADNMAVSLDAAFAEQSFGVDQGVTLVSDVKNSSIDWANVKYGVTDTDANDQTVTVVLPLLGSATWLASEAVQYNNSGTPVAMPIPGYADATADYYVPGAYVSADGGATRYPLFVAQSGDTPVALVARFKAPENESGDFRKDTLNLFMDPDIVTGDHVTKYLPDLSDTQEAAPYAATEFSAPVALGKSWSVYLKGGVAFESDAYISRGLESYDGLVENGFLTKGEDTYVLLHDAEHPDNQYDVEIVVNRELRDALTSGARVEDGKELRLWYQVSSRKGFTFTKPTDFTLTSADTDVAVVAPAEGESGVFNVILTGAVGSSALTLTAINGSPEQSFDLNAGTVVSKEGKTPFL
ncbi:MAG: hypothetical protein IJK02_12510, partial [Clostridia bacterium]|nr:hypothetical protein [Clostridia bacterium]